MLVAALVVAVVVWCERGVGIDRQTTAAGSGGPLMQRGAEKNLQRLMQD
jgi:preprotein translocase subunit SecG